MARLSWPYLVLALATILAILGLGGCGRADSSLNVLYVKYHEDGSRHLHTLDLANSKTRQLTDEGQLNIEASASPDGASVAFVSDRDGNREIYTMASDGSNQKRLTNYDGNEAWPAWSPDGTRIAFVRSDVDWDYGEIWTMEADGANQKRLAEVVYNGYPAWSPDGTMIASIIGGLHDGSPWGGFLHVMGSDGGNEQNFKVAVRVGAKDPLGGMRRVPIGGAPPLSWAPDSSRIAVSCLPESGALLPEKLEICVADVHSGDITYIAQNSVPDYFPVWSPDGSRIAFVSVRNGIDLNLYIMDSDGTSERALAPDDYAMAAPLWSPDGDRIAIVANQQVCIITVDGEDISRFGDSVWPYTPLSWME